MEQVHSAHDRTRTQLLSLARLTNLSSLAKRVRKVYETLQAKDEEEVIMYDEDRLVTKHRGPKREDVAFLRKIVKCCDVGK